MRQTKPLRPICAILSICLLLGMLSGCAPSRKTKEIEKTALGIDVAKYQGTVDWEAVGQSGVEFAMIRVGYRTLSDGVIAADSNGKYNLQEASKAGIAIGAYFFSTAVTVDEAREEAQWVADFISQYPITYPVVYDCEGFRDPGSRQHNMTNAERTDVALAFLEAIEELGYEGMFYGAKNELNAFWEMERIDKDYKVWVAQYPAEPYPQTEQSSYEGVHHMWQYTQEGSSQGIGTDVDLNVAYFGYDGIEPAKNSEPPEEVGPDPEALMRFEEVYEQVTAKVETNLRDIPSQGPDSMILYTLRNGELAERIGISDSGWAKVRFEGKIYYAKSSYLTTDMDYDPDAAAEAAAADPDGDGFQTQFRDADELVTAKELTNLRNMPSATREDSEVLFKLKHGEVAVCTGISDNGWCRVEYQGKTCYAKYSYLMPFEGIGDEDVGMAFTEVRDKVTPTQPLNLRSVPNTARKDTVVVKAQEGEVLHRIGVNKETEWSKVLYHGQVLYCSSIYLTVAEN